MTQPTTSGELETLAVREICVAIILQAEYQADLVIGFLQAAGIIPSDSPDGRVSFSLPRSLLLDLAATLQIGCWEQSGIHDHMDAGLPTFTTAIEELIARCEKPSTREATSDLNITVWTFWLKHFGWNGRNILGADISTRGLEDDHLVELISQCLWENRDQLS